MSYGRLTETFEPSERPDEASEIARLVSEVGEERANHG
jgi:hypothetical protein